MMNLLSFLTVLFLSIAVIEAHWPHDTIDAMAVSPDESEIFAYTRNTLLKSVDFGVTWQPIRSFTSFRKSYLALSPYNSTLYMYQEGIMFRSSDLISWETPNIQACQYEFHVNIKRRTTFVESGALIAGIGKIYKEDGDGVFSEILNANFNNCPSLAGVPNSDIVYAGAVNGLLKSIDGGETWDSLLPISDIVEIKVQQNVTFIITNSTEEGGICMLNANETSCTDISIPEVAPADKVREGESQPTDLTYTSDGTLIITRSNSYAIYYSNDLGVTWEARVKTQSFETLGHIPDDAWVFDESEEFTHIEGNILGTWRGIFTTDNGGGNWTYRDTIRRAITTLSLMKASEENGGYFLMAACTYVDGCFYGTPDNLTPNVGILKSGYYFSLYFSPAYDKDQLRFERSEEILFRLEGSETGTKVTLPELPKILNETKISIKSIDFSDTFEEDGIMFVSGYNIGVLKSEDRGQTFRRVFDGDAFGGVTKVILSPTWSVDGTMAALQDPNLNEMEWVILDDIQYIYVSNDFGESWRKLVWTSRPFRDLTLVKVETEPVVVAVDVNGRLWSHSANLTLGWFPYQKIRNTNFANIRPLGFGYDGLAASPDGKLFAAGWAEGGMMLGEISDIGDGNHTVTRRRWAKPHPWNPKGVPIVFARSPPRVDDVYGLRMFTSHIVFSPDFANDRTMFAADMFSIYMSTNRGTDWTKVFTL